MTPDTLAVLLSWAAYFMGYPNPQVLPRVLYQPHAFFVEYVCGGKECNAVGWYPDNYVIYIDEQFAADPDEAFASSLVVHELTHYLQHLSGQYDSLSCVDSLKREREAYRVQNDYLIEGRGAMMQIRPAPTSCNYPVDGQ